ncbi:hypothetical protein B0H21DRAFT_890603 [Amylocystis lapponica]|nr:hypothetical protein B0H21DRAFT_890603 [Amylocystis lapponica]
MSDVYTFSTLDGKTYTRQLFGLEAAAAVFSEGDIFHYSGLCSVQFPTAPNVDQLLPAVRASWLRLRHLSPAIAMTSSRLPDKAWLYTYTVPESQSAAERWARDTVISYEDELSIVERQLAIADRIWRPSAGRHALELHFGPANKAEGKWVFAIRGPHVHLDGRAAIPLLEQLVRYLQEELVSASPAPAWGTEPQRLTATAVVLTGEFDKYMAAVAASPPAGPPPPPAGFVPFLPPPVYDPSAKAYSVSRLVVFDQAKTEKMRDLCRARGRTMTQLIDSIVAVSHVEAHLREAQAAGGERFDTLAGLYENATNWLLPLTFKDQRPALREHLTLQSPKGTSLFAIDGYNLVLDMGKIRSAVAFDKATGTFARSTNEFWDSTVAHYVDTWGQQKFDLTNFVARWAGFHAGLDEVSAEKVSIPAAVTSSVGDIDRLGMMRDLKPGSGKVVVHDILMAVNSNNPLLIAVYWSFNGKFTLHFHGGGAYHSDRAMDTFAGTFESWVDALLA